MIWINGQFTEQENLISVHDRGLLLGESLFETLLVKQGVTQFWAAHWQRLEKGCAALNLPLPYSTDALATAAAQLIDHQQAHQGRWTLRLTLSGGAGGRGLVPTASARTIATTCIMHLTQAPSRPAAMALHISQMPRLAGHPHAGFKTAAYLDNICARREALAHGADAAILLNQHQRVASACAANLFIGDANRLITPPVSEGALAGVIRNILLAANDKNKLPQIEEAAIHIDQIKTAPIIFMTNSLMELMPAFIGTQTSNAPSPQTEAMVTRLLDYLQTD